MHARPVLLLGLLVTPAWAQATRWQLPERGGARYTRSLQADVKVDPDGARVPDLWQGPTPAAIVLDGEFDASRNRRAAPVHDLRELVAQLGFDVGTLRAGRGQLDLAHGDRFQPVRSEVSYGPIGEDGQQTFTATLEFDAKAARAGNGPPAHVPKLTGKVQGRRTFDRATGVVTKIEGDAELTLDHPAHQDGEQALPVRRQHVRITDSWQQPQVLSDESPQWRSDIVDAIRSSIVRLRKLVEERCDQAPQEGGDPYHDIQPGELALMLLALRHGGEDARDPLLEKGYASLRRRTIEGTYSLAVAILALEALYTPAGEWEQLRAGRIKAPLPRTLPPEDFALLRGWADKLLDNIDSTVDAAYLRRWHYGPSKEYDNSNTQYALLGLYAAQLCGIEVSPQVWTAAANHWLDCMVEAGDAAAPEMVLQKDLARTGRTRSSYKKVQAVGWGYRDDNPTGSMTAAGITGLTLCNAGLRQLKRGSPKLLNEIDNAVRGGFLWLQRELSVRRNPGRDPWASWHLYYLYGLERACELNQVARLGDRDWYFEGSMQLLATQQADGGWGSLEDTAFGLLFLKKSALPAITGR